MKPKIGTKVYCVYENSILVEEVAFLGNESFIISSFGSDTWEDSWEWYYEDFETEWFIDLKKAKEELLSRFEDEDCFENLKIKKIFDGYYELVENE